MLSAFLKVDCYVIVIRLKGQHLGIQGSRLRLLTSMTRFRSIVGGQYVQVCRIGPAKSDVLLSWSQFCQIFTVLSHFNTSFPASTPFWAFLGFLQLSNKIDFPFSSVMFNGLQINSPHVLRGWVDPFNMWPWINSPLALEHKTGGVSWSWSTHPSVWVNSPLRVKWLKG